MTLKTRRGWTSILVVVAVCCVPATGARAQDVIANPITSRDVDRAAARLELSFAQREELDLLYQRYLEQNTMLREQETEPLLARASSIGPLPLTIMDPRELRDAVRELENLMTGLRAIDDGLFEGLAPILSDGQAETLRVVMQARARQRFGSGPARLAERLNRAGLVDLSELYREIDLAPADRTATEPLLLAYEQALAMAAQGMHLTSGRMLLDLSDAVKARTATLQNASKSQVRRSLDFHMRAMWLAASAGMRQHLQQICDLNRRTVRELAAELPPADGDDLQSKYLARAYPDVPRATHANRVFRAAAELDDLPEETWKAVEAVAIRFRGDRDQIIDEAVDRVDDMNDQLAWMSLGSRRGSSRQLQELGTRLAALENTAISAVREVLGPDHVGQLTRAMARGTAPDRRPAASAGGRAEPGIRAAPAPARDNFDRFVPLPIPFSTVEAWASRVGLSPDDAGVAELLHEDYLESWRQVRDGDLKALLRTRQQLDRDLRQAVGRVTMERIATTASLREHVLASLRSLDRTLFDDLGILVTTDTQVRLLQRLARQRKREVHRLGAEEVGRRGHGWMPPAPRESNVDVVALLEGLDLDDGDRAAAADVLADYEAAAADAYRRRFDIARRHERAAAEQIIATRQGGRGSSQRERLVRMWHQQERERHDVNRSIVDLNRATLARFAEVLPAGTAGLVRRAYYRAAYPEAYDVQSAADRHLSAALALPDLTASQRGRIIEIVAEYRPAYEAVCERLAHALEPESAGQGLEAGQRSRVGGSRTEALLLERDELNARALRRLRQVLDAPQQAALRLPRPETAPGGG